MRMTRTMMLEVLRQDYIRTAWSKGLKERVVVVRHAVKNVLIPVVTLIGLQLPILVGGAVIIENIFNLPGLGRLMLVALNDRDYLHYIVPHPPGPAQHRRSDHHRVHHHVGAVIISEAALSSLGFGLPDLGERLTNDGLDAPTQQCLRGVPIPRGSSTPC